MTTALFADRRGHVIIEQRATNLSIENWTSETFSFDWRSGEYAQIRAWDELGPLGFSSSQSGTRITVTVYFRHPVRIGETTQYSLGVVIAGMASGTGPETRARWYWSPGAPTREFVQGITFPPNSTLFSIAPTPATQSSNYLEWRYTDTDAEWQTTVDLTYSVSTPGGGALLREARLDIGMPYGTERGCVTPYAGCAGPYHGFFHGASTDLVLDAYYFGAALNIQNALLEDAAANPGRYRYQTARCAEDMSRYFTRNQLRLSHDQAYQAGDVAFLDVDGDGIADQVLIVSQVDKDGRPVSLVEVSGPHPGNPSGRGIEHAWSAHHEQSVQGHGRPGTPPSSLPLAPRPETLQELRVTMKTPETCSAALALKDASGRSTSGVFDENLIASNVGSFIPYLPGGRYLNSGATQTVRLFDPLANAAEYLAQVSARAPTTYELIVQTYQDGGLTATSTTTRPIAGGATHGIPLRLNAPGGVLTFSATAPMNLPVITATPVQLRMLGRTGRPAVASMVLAEGGKQVAVNDVAVGIVKLGNQAGQAIPGSSCTVVPSRFNLPAGGQQEVQLRVDLGHTRPGLYLGNVLVTSTNGGALSVPLSVEVAPAVVNVPLIRK